MKEIHVTTITEAVAGLAVEACCRLPEDMVEAMRAARALEPSPVGRNILDQILENAAIAARETMPICQDTGLTVVFAEVGQDVRIVGGLACGRRQRRRAPGLCGRLSAQILRG